MRESIKRGLERLFFSKSYMSWKEYKDRIDFIDMFCFQNQTRLESIANIGGREVYYEEIKWKKKK